MVGDKAMNTLDSLISLITSSRRTLWILCGLPYSGKTHLSREIVKNTFVVYVSIDNIFKEAGFDWDSNYLPDEKSWEEIFNVSYKQTQEALSKGLNVLYDSTNHTRESRDELRKIAKEVSAETRVIYVDVPVETIRQRWEENLHNKTRSIVDKKLIDMTINDFEEPGEDEGVARVGNA